MAVLAFVGLGITTLYSAYTSARPHKNEINLFSELLQAKEALAVYIQSKETLSPVLLDAINTYDLFKMKHFIRIISYFNDRRLEELVHDYMKTSESYFGNLSAFIHQAIPGASLHEKYREATRQFDRDETPLTKARITYFRLLIEEEALRLDDTCEEGAYAKVNQLRRELEVSQLLGNTREELTAEFEAAKAKHKEFVLNWAGSQNEFTRAVFDNLGDDFLSQGRKEVLKERIEQIDLFIKTGFEGIRKSFQKLIGTAYHDSLVILSDQRPSPFENILYSLIFFWDRKISIFDSKQKILFKCIQEEKKIERGELGIDANYIQTILKGNELKRLIEGLQQELPRESKSLLTEFERNRNRYLRKAGSLLLTSRDNVEKIILGQDQSKEVQLKRVYQEIKNSHPKLQGQLVEEIHFDARNQTLSVRGQITESRETFTANLGGDVPLKLIQSDFRVILQADSSSEIAEMVAASILPTEILGLIKWNAKVEVLFSSRHSGRVSTIGQQGVQDFMHSRFAIQKKVTYWAEESQVRFEGIYLGLSVRENPVLFLGDYAGRVDPVNGTQATINLQGIQRLDNKIIITGIVNGNSDQQVKLERGKPIPGLLLSLINGKERSPELTTAQYRDTFYPNGQSSMVWSATSS